MLREKNNKYIFTKNRNNIPNEYIYKEKYNETETNKRTKNTKSMWKMSAFSQF